MFLLKGLVVSAAILGIAAALLIVAGQLGLLEGRRPFDLGAREGRLKPCPPTPNCVCSQATDAPHAIAPLRYEGDGAAAFARLEALVADWPGAVIVAEGEGYLHAEVPTRWLRFVDDVELLLDPAARVIHVRSASRLGYSDLGANRRRVEAIRSRFSPSPAGAE
jgi:uncharacterized protein (DUF1499 family)